MKEFHSIAHFIEHVVLMDVAVVLELHHGLKKCAVAVEQTAKDEIGHYQQAAGNFPTWAPLADSTEAEKARLGYPADAPLLRDGTLRDSISHEVQALEARIGSTSDIMVYQEFGTNKIPPRPVLGPAAVRNKTKIERIFGESVVEGLLYGSGINMARLEK